MHTIIRFAGSRSTIQRSFRVSHKLLSANVASDSSDGSEETVSASPEELQLKNEEITMLQAKLAEESKKLSDLKDKYLRALADGENVRNRTKKELENSKVFSIQSFAKDLLPVSDVFEKALESVPEEEKSKNATLSNLCEGVAMTYNQLHQVATAPQFT